MSVAIGMRSAGLALAGSCAFALTLSSSARAFQLVADLPSPQPLGTTVTWAVTGAPPHPGDVVDFQLKVFHVTDGEPARVMYDFTRQRTFEWTPMRELQYVVSAVVRNQTTGETTTLNRSYYVTPLAGDSPTVAPTRNPLVALYSAPLCAAGRTMEVTFVPAGDRQIQRTNRQECDGQLTMNFLIAGMRGETTFNLRHVLRDALGTVVARGPLAAFTSGAPAGASDCHGGHRARPDHQPER